MGINVECGQFSYAETPKKKYYEKILGVTGTLKDMHKNLREAMSAYEINTESYAPSMFGKSNLDFKPTDPDYFLMDSKSQ